MLLILAFCPPLHFFLVTSVVPFSIKQKTLLTFFLGVSTFLTEGKCWQMKGRKNDLCLSPFLYINMSKILIRSGSGSMFTHNPSLSLEIKSVSCLCIRMKSWWKRSPIGSFRESWDLTPARPLWQGPFGSSEQQWHRTRKSASPLSLSRSQGEDRDGRCSASPTTLSAWARGGREEIPRASHPWTSPCGCPQLARACVQLLFPLPQPVTLMPFAKSLPHGRIFSSCL